MIENPPQRADHLIGMRVGSYLVEELLGAGGMGSVYRGVQPEIGKRVAIKFLADEFNANNDLVQRFFQEARAVNLIGHENIVDIFDFGKTPEGRNFFVMELLEGPSLERLLSQEKALGTMRTVEVAGQISRALAAAHERGIIHRDLKPDNCFLVTRAGRKDFVKLLDFGIAKLTVDGGEGGGKTQTGMILGTPGYMAPEQAGGGVIDQRCDIYALGVMIYRMLGGNVPFDGPSLAAIFRRQLTEEAVSLRKLRADVPEQLDALILRMLQREPVDRPNTMLDVERELASVSKGEVVGNGSVVWYSAPLSELESRPLATNVVAPLKKKRPPLVFGAMALTTVIAIAAIAVVGTSRDRQHASEEAKARVAVVTPPPAPPPVQETKPIVAPPPPVEPPKASTRYTLRIESDPDEAPVLEGDKRKELGKTPLNAALDGPTTLYVKLPGYKEERVEAKSDTPTVKLTLHKLQRQLPKLKEGDRALPKASHGFGLDE